MQYENKNARRKDGQTLAETAEAAGCGISQVKRIMAMHSEVKTA